MTGDFHEITVFTGRWFLMSSITIWSVVSYNFQIFDPLEFLAAINK